MSFKEYFDDEQNRKKFYWRVPLYIAAVLCIWWGIDNISLAKWVADNPDWESKYGRNTNSLVGTYAYTDAVGHEYVLETRTDGTASLKMTSEPRNELDRIAYSNARNGSEGTWMQSSMMRGNDVWVPYFHAIIGGEDLYFCEGYVYNSYSSMEQRNRSAGNPYNKIK